LHREQAKRQDCRRLRRRRGHVGRFAACSYSKSIDRAVGATTGIPTASMKPRPAGLRVMRNLTLTQNRRMMDDPRHGCECADVLTASTSSLTPAPSQGNRETTPPPQGAADYRRIQISALWFPGCGGTAIVSCRSAPDRFVQLRRNRRYGSRLCRCVQAADGWTAEISDDGQAQPQMSSSLGSASLQRRGSREILLLSDNRL
jgi:hypothetical protein